jgi:hypothetical protein
MIKLYQAEWCPFSHRIRAKLTELGSRFFGTVPFENIEGKAFVIFWLLSHIKPL